MADVEVLVIGSGIAGLCAAVSAAESGCTGVLVAEAAHVVGGSSRLSSGIMLGPGNRHQKAAGYSDSAEAFYLDYMNVNHWSLRGDVAKALATQAGPTLDWLEDLGVQFHPEPVFGGAEIAPRCLAAVGRGQGIIDALHRRAKALGVEIVLGKRIDRLLVEDRSVVGAAAGDDRITARAVVVATGGFGANPHKLREYFPSTASAGDWLWYIGADGAQGDGLDLGAQVNARIIGHDRGLRLLHPNFVRTLESFIPGWLVLVNKEGRRFVDETAPYGILCRQTILNGEVAYVIFDHQALDPGSSTRVSSYRHTVPGHERRSPNWNPAMIREMSEAGRIATAESIAALAEKLGLPAQQLADTIAQYNEGCRTGHDAQGKDAPFLREITVPPYYGAEVRLATIASTWTGLEINGFGQVIDNAGYPVPGLYAAGETTGGVMAYVYISDGNNLSNGATFGRIAGRSAAAYSARPT